MSQPGDTHHGHGQTTKESVKETLISIIIAFVLAFVFRSFVVEAFIIPTGSMAPTLMGAHMRFNDPQTGSTWAVGPRDFLPGEPGLQEPAPYQGAPLTDARGNRIAHPIQVHEPLTGAAVTENNVARRAGDRILVLKYLSIFQDPSPFDVVVFKNPFTPTQNFIKRLIALPGEQVALVDGDIFTRPAGAGSGGGPGANPWVEPGWQIRRKPVRVQRAVWQPLYDTAQAPVTPPMGFQDPWAFGAGTWERVDGGRRLRQSGAGASVLRWDSSAPWISGTASPLSGALVERTYDRTISDRYAYNEGTPYPEHRTAFPVSDVRLRAVVRFDEGASAGAPRRVAGVVAARGHEFIGEIEGAVARVRMRPATDGQAGEWKTLAEGPAPELTPGSAVEIEVWHVDQEVSVWVGGRRILSGQYEWGPDQRIEFATGTSLITLIGRWRGQGNPLGDPAIYRKAEVRWEFSGGGFDLMRVALDRDLHYQPGTRQSGEPLRATHPRTTMTLGPDQFFVCGDNSPASDDARSWRDPDPWVAEQIDETPGIVPRKLMLGKAFFVYFPALAGDSPLPVPDFGRLRFIQ